jgi:hypothetical protein
LKLNKINNKLTTEVQDPQHQHNTHFVQNEVPQYRVIASVVACSDGFHEDQDAVVY